MHNCTPSRSVRLRVGSAGYGRSFSQFKLCPSRVTLAQSSIDIEAMLDSLEIADDLQSMQEKLGGVFKVRMMPCHTSSR